MMNVSVVVGSDYYYYYQAIEWKMSYLSKDNVNDFEFSQGWEVKNVQLQLRYVSNTPFYFCLT